jgi:hypothetical protein
LTKVRKVRKIERSQRAIKKRENKMTQWLGIEIPAENDFCVDCEQDFPKVEMFEKYDRMDILWCKECRDNYDPTPYEQWEVTSPSGGGGVVMNEYGRVF